MRERKNNFFFFLIFIWNGQEMGKVMDQGMIQEIGMVKKMEKRKTIMEWFSE